MSSCPGPSVHFPPPLIDVHKHIKKEPSHHEEGITALTPEEIKCENEVSEITNPSPRQTHDEETMVSCSESSPAPGVHFPTVLTDLHSHIKKSPSQQEEDSTMLKSEDIKSEDEVPEISSTQTSYVEQTHDEETLASCSETSPGAHLPKVLVYFHNHIKKPQSHPEEGITIVKSEDIKSEDEVLEISSTQTSSAKLLTNLSPRQTPDEERTASCSDSSPGPIVHIPTVLIYIRNHQETSFKKSPSHQEEGITVLNPEGIKCEDEVSEISSTSSATLLTNTSPGPTQANTGKELIHQCSECGRIFTAQSHLQVHQCTHTEERPYSCLWCEKSFAKPNNLKQHQRIHTGEKPYQCLECGQSFTRQSHLKRHQRIHTGEKPYHCSDCGLSFTSQSDLRRHQRIQARQRQYQCSECQHSFTRQTDLYRHQRFHTGEKTYHSSVWSKF